MAPAESVVTRLDRVIQAARSGSLLAPDRPMPGTRGGGYGSCRSSNSSAFRAQAAFAAGSSSARVGIGRA